MQVAGAAPGRRIELPPEESHHLARVLRRRPGDEIEVLAESGEAFHAVIEEVIEGAPREGGLRVVIRVADAVAVEPPPLLPWAVAVGLAKGSGTDTAVRLASELGLEAWIPLLCERSVVREAPEGRRERWI
ncbi:MAG: 16S rRNA (uracil(1498)-N(3))-methyltransferase, partial [Planctomycetes bacterium]|nr:16S rRNA (uracil(1498)-N(3))-methyltransferase [Planctomycetota bacterium]